MSKDQPSLPTKRAFVVQLRAEAQVVQHDFKGRVEHITSGQATRFDSLEELASFMAQIVVQQEKAEDETR